MSPLQRALCLESKTVLNVLIACSSSTSDQAENASFASSIVDDGVLGGRLDLVQDVRVPCVSDQDAALPPVRGRDRRSDRHGQVADLAEVIERRYQARLFTRVSGQPFVSQLVSTKTMSAARSPGTGTARYFIRPLSAPTRFWRSPS